MKLGFIGGAGSFILLVGSGEGLGAVITGPGPFSNTGLGDMGGGGGDLAGFIISGDLAGITGF